MYQHNNRVFGSCYTASRLPVELVFQQTFPTREEALACEVQIKGWSRKKKQAMLNQDWRLVSLLAKSPHNLK
ncbi:MAG: hypothetical protein HWE18_05730 [Gammaproteobacteria bacterium]|nr:hypothetical protein [Gammaproteobacteria bacterium]